MAMYNEKVIEHFTNPHNAGDMDSPDGEGTYGSPVCGDIMKIMLRVDENDVIVDAKFKTFGCGSAIASSSVATDMIIGKTVEDALKVTNEQVVEELGGLPAVKVHCSILADHAIKSAIYDYAKKHGKSYAGLDGFDPEGEEGGSHQCCDIETALPEHFADL